MLAAEAALIIIATWRYVGRRGHAGLLRALAGWRVNCLLSLLFEELLLLLRAAGGQALVEEWPGWGRWWRLGGVCPLRPDWDIHGHESEVRRGRVAGSGCLVVLINILDRGRFGAAELFFASHFVGGIAGWSAGQEGRHLGVEGDEVALEGGRDGGLLRLVLG